MKLQAFLLLFAITAVVRAGRLSSAENLRRLSTCGTSPVRKESVAPTIPDADFESAPQFKIVNGRNSGPRPYAVQLLHTIIEGYAVDHCGGTLISSRHVLTAGHCVVDDIESFCQGEPIKIRNETSRWNIVLKSRCGEMNSNELCDAKESKIHAKPTKIFLNRRFQDSKCSHGDIAIIELDKDYYSEDGVVPACVAGESTRFDQYNIHQLTSFGWGYDPKLNSEETSGGFHSFLQEVKLKLQQCDERPFSDHICTEEFKRNVCKGDSGGGLIIPAASTSNPTIIGVVSRGERCDVMYKRQFSYKAKGGLFTDVRLYNAFICRATGICPVRGLAGLKRQRKARLQVYPTS